MTIKILNYYGPEQLKEIATFIGKQDSFIEVIMRLASDRAYQKGRLDEARINFQSTMKQLAPYKSFNFSYDDDQSWLAEGERVQDQIRCHGKGSPNAMPDIERLAEDAEGAYEDAFTAYKESLKEFEKLTATRKEFSHLVFEFLENLAWTNW